jgi:HlyD family secretion protein
MVDIARPESVVRKKKMKRYAYGVAGATAILLVTVFVSQLKPAAPSVDKNTLWPDVVKRGPMVRQVRGTGTLVPEDTRWIPATTAGRVERILLRSGADVMPDSVIVELGSPELEQSVTEARLQLESAVAQLVNRRAELDSSLLTQRASTANMESEARQAELQAQADEALAKDGLQGALIAKKNRARADDLASRTTIEKTRLDLAENTLKSQLAVQEAEVNRLRATYDLRRQQLEKLKVRAGIKGKLQVVPVEVGAQLQAGANVARVADPAA